MARRCNPTIKNGIATDGSRSQNDRFRRFPAGVPPIIELHEIVESLPIAKAAAFLKNGSRRGIHEDSACAIGFLADVPDQHICELRIARGSEHAESLWPVLGSFPIPPRDVRIARTHVYPGGIELNCSSWKV